MGADDGRPGGLAPDVGPPKEDGWEDCCGDAPDATSENRVHRRGQVAGLRVLAEVEEDPLPPVDVGIQLFDEPPDRVELLLAGIDDQRVRASLGNDERGALGTPRRILARCRRGPGSWSCWGRRGGGSGGCNRAARLPRRRAEAAARKELREDLRDLLSIGVLQLDDLELARRHVHVDQLQDVEQAPDVRRHVGDHEQIRVPIGVQGALSRHERAKQVHRIGSADELERRDQGDHLIARDVGLDLVTYHCQGRRRWRSLLRDDPVDAARLHGGQAVDVEDREQHGEDVFDRDPTRRLDRHLLAAHLGREHVVEHHQLARGLEHDLEIGIVEVEHHEPAGRRRSGLRGRLSRHLALGLPKPHGWPALRSRRSGRGRRRWRACSRRCRRSRGGRRHRFCGCLRRSRRCRFWRGRARHGRFALRDVSSGCGSRRHWRLGGCADPVVRNRVGRLLRGRGAARGERQHQHCLRQRRQLLEASWPGHGYC